MIMIMLMMNIAMKSSAPFGVYSSDGSFVDCGVDCRSGGVGVLVTGAGSAR